MFALKIYNQQSISIMGALAKKSGHVIDSKLSSSKSNKKSLSLKDVMVAIPKEHVEKNRSSAYEYMFK
jgi:hypothetical protein